SDRPDSQDRRGIAVTLWRRVLRRGALERELDAELRDHIEREVADGVCAGQSEADVRRQIRLTSGGLDQVKEASRDVLGRKVTVNAATPATIVGVMPDGIRFIDFTDVWLPLVQMPGLAGQRRDTRPLMMIGRLPGGTDL